MILFSFAIHLLTGKYHEFVLTQVIYFPSIFINLVLESCLKQNGLYFYKGKKSRNRYKDNFKLAVAFIHNSSYIL